MVVRDIVDYMVRVFRDDGGWFCEVSDYSLSDGVFYRVYITWEYGGGSSVKAVDFRDDFAIVGVSYHVSYSNPDFVNVLLGAVIAGGWGGFDG